MWRLYHVYRSALFKKNKNQIEFISLFFSNVCQEKFNNNTRQSWMYFVLLIICDVIRELARKIWNILIIFKFSLIWELIRLQNRNLLYEESEKNAPNEI